MTKAEQLIRDATTAGLSISAANGRTRISRERNHAVLIHENGQIIRADTDLTICGALTIAQARKLLLL